MDNTEGLLPPVSTPEDPHASIEQMNQHAQPTEIREAIPSDPEEQMKEFDQLRKREDKIGEELDRQLMDVLDRKTEWANKLPWTEMVEKEYDFEGEEGEPKSYQKEERITYRVESTDSAGNPVTLTVWEQSRRPGITATEKNAQGELVGWTLICGRTYSDVDTPRHLWDTRGMVGFVDPKDQSSQREKYIHNLWSPHFRVNELASTAYGYDDYDEWHHKRQRYVAPGMEHLRSPLEYARETMDKLERGQITAKSVSEPGEWKPVTEPIQPPARNT